MTLVITVSLLKGGVSKSTVALALAEAAAVTVPATVLDCDPMGSLVRWGQLAEATGRPLQSRVVGMPVADLGRRIGAISEGQRLVVIDAPPGSLNIATGAIAVCDRLVMPCPPEAAALDRVPATMKLAAEHGKPARVVLTQVRRHLGDRAAAVSALEGWGVGVYQAELPLAVAVARCYGQHVGGGVLRAFGYQLLSEILKEVQS